MNSNFLKFKKRAAQIRVLKSVLLGLSAGLLSGGIFLLLSRLAVISPVPIISLPIGAGVCLVVTLAVFFILGSSDKSLAKRLDKEFSLHERVQTMIEHSDEASSGVLQLQREDAEASLSKISTRSLKVKKLWIYITALALGAAITLTAAFVPNLRDEGGDDDQPFALSNMQRTGLNELIANVESSEMQEEYKALIAAELRTLLSDLESVTKMSVMRSELAESMAYILEVTCNSSSTAEILDALWKNGNFYMKHLAFALNTSDWEKDKEWGIFAEKLSGYESVLCGGGTDGGEPLTPEESFLKLKGAIDSSAVNIPLAIGSSGIKEDDALRTALKRLATADEPEAKGYAVLNDMIETQSYEESKESLKKTLDAFSPQIFTALGMNKKNADVGEYAITKLSTLFLVPAPEFERPDFVKYNQTIDDSGKEDNNNDENSGSEGGGVGEGSVFGSNDLVLDPITGEYVEYGTLLDKYYAVVFEKLQNGSYSDEQKKMIENYFALLYGGLKKEEGN